VTTTSNELGTQVAPLRRLQHLPVTLFASVMGIGGLSLAWRRAALVWDVDPVISQALFWVGLAVYVLLVGLYVATWVLHPAAARAELRHPIRMAFVPTITIGLLILATAGQDLLTGPARVAWWVGAVGHLVMTMAVLGAWFEREDIGLSQVTPAWFIPVVGNVITPLGAATLGSVQLAWFSWSVGLVFYVALLPVLLLRVLLHGDPIPPKLLPTIAIFVAPPAVTGISWGVLTGRFDDPVFHIFFAATMAFLLLVLAQLPRLRRIPFALPYWAYTFPLTAASVISTIAASALPGTAYDVIAVAVLALATVVVTTVAALTVVAAARHQICVPE
jgi:tellurite resistance protein